MEYSYKPWARYKTPASVAGQVMSDLAKEGNLNAKALVDVSRPVNAPLHSEFEWRDHVAAEKWREQQARVFIDAVVIVPGETEVEPVRAFFQVEEQSNYEPIHVILKDENKTEQLLKRALFELTAFQSKYNSLEIFKNLFAEIDRIKNSITEN